MLFKANTLKIKHSMTSCKTSKVIMYPSPVGKRAARVRIPRNPPGLDTWWHLGYVIVEGADTSPIEVTRTTRVDWSDVDLEILLQSVLKT